MPSSEELLLAAVRDAPRRFALPALPADRAAAEAAGPETALAWAMQEACTALQRRRAPDAGLQDTFTAALATLIRRALAPAGDIAFQALLLRTQHAEVAEHAALAAGAAADRRVLRTAVAAVAHPGKLRGMAPGPRRQALGTLHALAAQGDWLGLWGAAQRELERAPAATPEGAALQALATHVALQRLLRLEALQQQPAVQHHLALLAQAGPRAGSASAAARGEAAGRAGAQAEERTAACLLRIAGWMNQRAVAGMDAATGGRFRVLRGLRPPAGFPGRRPGAKDEWDAALVRGGSDAPAELVLLAEAKASPGSAATDLPRLLRGLQRLAQADPAGEAAFRCSEGTLRLRGATLHRLLPAGGTLPPAVFYACPAEAEPRPPVLHAAARTLLLSQPASLAHAAALARGEAAPHEELRALWQQLLATPRLGAVLHQYATARAARAAMLHPDDLQAAAARALAPPQPDAPVAGS